MEKSQFDQHTIKTSNTKDTCTSRDTVIVTNGNAALFTLLMAPCILKWLPILFFNLESRNLTKFLSLLPDHILQHYTASCKNRSFLWDLVGEDGSLLSLTIMFVRIKARSFQ